MVKNRYAPLIQDADAIPAVSSQLDVHEVGSSCAAGIRRVQGVDQEQSVSLAPRVEFPKVARRLVLCSRPRGPTQAAVPSTVEDAASTVTERHVFLTVLSKATLRPPMELLVWVS